MLAYYDMEDDVYRPRKFYKDSKQDALLHTDLAVQE